MPCFRKWINDDDGFFKAFARDSGDLGCTRPCAYYEYEPKCREIEEDRNSYAELLKERDGQQENSDENDDVIQVQYF